MEQIATGMPTAQGTAQSKSIAKNSLYRQLKAQPNLTLTSATLQNFMQQSQSTTRQLFNAVEESIVATDMATTQSQTNTIAPQDAIDNN